VPRNPLAAHPPWRQLLIISVLLPVAIVAAVLAFAWPAARIAPRDLPVGIVGAGPAGGQAVENLARAQPGGFDFHLYPDAATASAAIRERIVYGAFIVGPTEVTVLEASAASATVAQLLSAVGQHLADHAAQQATSRTGPPIAAQARIVDLVPASAQDPRGLVLGSALLPLTICGIVAAAAVALLLAFRPAWRQMSALVVVSVLVGLGAYLVAQPFLGALPGEHLASWGALGLTLLAVASATAGLIALVGTAGLAVGAALMVFVGNPFSGVTSAPELLPGAVDHLGQWLPPGAGANLLRSTAYFHGNGAAGHLAVLIAWSVAGLSAIFVGHHTSIRFAAHPTRYKSTPFAPAAGQPTAVASVEHLDSEMTPQPLRA